MKNLYILLISICFSFSLFAQTPVNISNNKTQNDQGAKISFENTVMDYGTIEHKSDGERIFQFTNDGNQPLVISNCRGSCGCTVPKCPTDPILPGDSGVIKVKYDTKRIGKFTKTITVNSNAGNSTLLTIKGEVLGPATLPNAPEKNNSGPVESPK